MNKVVMARLVPRLPGLLFPTESVSSSWPGLSRPPTPFSKHKASAPEVRFFNMLAGEGGEAWVPGTSPGMTITLYLTIFTNENELDSHGLVPRIHAAPREPADIFAVLAVPSGGLFSHDGVDGRVKPDHDDLVSEAAP